MVEIDQIQKKIADIYKVGEQEPKSEVPLQYQVMQWVYFAKEYMSAASIVDKELPQSYLPRLQLTGQAIESSLKACLASAQIDPPNQHNLVSLVRLTIDQGFKLEETEMAAIVHLQHFYYRDLATDTKYKSRYPTKTTESLGGAVPYNKTFGSIVNSLVEQAEKRN